MERSTRATSWRTRGTGRASSSGRMGESTMENGSREGSMESECTKIIEEKRRRENGRMEREFNGYDETVFDFTENKYTIFDKLLII